MPQPPKATVSTLYQLASLASGTDSRLASKIFSCPVAEEAFALEAALRGNEWLIPRQLHFSDTANEMITGAVAADFVLGPNRFGATVQSNLPSLGFLL